MAPKQRKTVLAVNSDIINVIKVDGQDYLSLTEMARNHGGDQSIYNWMRNRNVVEFLGIWESMNNPDFKGVEFDTFKQQAGLNSFTNTPRKWITATNAIGIISKAGRNGGTYAHVDICFEFGTWISPEFKLLLIKEFQRLKSGESDLQLWDSRRYLSMVNYKLQNLAVKNTIIPASKLPSSKHGIHYANEADLLNVIIFGRTAAEWKTANGEAARRGENQRDSATISQLILLANLESLNSMYIDGGKSQEERAQLLQTEAQRQMKALRQNQTTNQLELGVNQNVATPYSSEKPLKIDSPNGFDDTIGIIAKAGDKKPPAEDAKTGEPA
jgi:hypothetical protein